MKLVKFTTDDHPVFINPAYVVSVKKGMKDTAIQTTAINYTVKESVDVVLRLLGAEEARDITPALALPKNIDL
ncbi:MAG: hypothetical protein EOP22_02825 [Hyphomicrobiales bacterium]|nr:MAG: hypothetical protein EOP22_02825 [Hyphomicrobiales bacterium]